MEFDSFLLMLPLQYKGVRHSSSNPVYNFSTSTCYLIVSYLQLLGGLFPCGPRSYVNFFFFPFIYDDTKHGYKFFNSCHYVILYFHFHYILQVQTEKKVQLYYKGPYYNFKYLITITFWPFAASGAFSVHRKWSCCNRNAGYQTELSKNHPW